MAKKTKVPNINSVKTILEETLLEQPKLLFDLYETTVKEPRLDWPKPKRVFLLGLGSSLHAVQGVAYALRAAQFGAEVFAISPLEFSKFAVTPSPTDWVVGVSHRGGSARVREALKIARKRQFKTVWVVAQGAPDCEDADQTWRTGTLEKIEPHTQALSSTALKLTLKLFPDYFEAHWAKLLPEIQLLTKQLSDGISDQKCAVPSICVGEYEAGMLASEVALKCIEILQLPVRAFGSEAYFHGPRFSRKPDDLIWRFDHYEDPREVDWAKLSQIEHWKPVGAQPLDWLPRLIEAQWRLLAIALQMGKNPDYTAS